MSASREGSQCPLFVLATLSPFRVWQTTPKPLGTAVCSLPWARALSPAGPALAASLPAFAASALPPALRPGQPKPLPRPCGDSRASAIGSGGRWPVLPGAEPFEPCPQALLGSSLQVASLTSVSSPCGQQTSETPRPPPRSLSGDTVSCKAHSVLICQTGTSSVLLCFLSACARIFSHVQ